MNQESKKEEKQIIPDQLNIIIRTSIPGFQRIEYKPSMTIKDNDSKGVQFNPLFKLDSAKISKIPEEYRIKQFFNKGLFQSLLNYNGATPAKNLTYATRAGYVNNNIKVTLDTIFPVNSVIYINKKPYAIGDVQWTTGDWKIEVKQKKEEIDINKIKDPRLYSQLVREEIISGEEQLNNIPESIKVGNNYSGPPIASGVKTETAATPPIPTPTMPISTLIPPSVKASSQEPIINTLALQPKIQPDTQTETQLIKPIPPTITKEIEPIKPSHEIVPYQTEKSIPKLENKPYTEIIEEISPEEQKIFEPFIESLKSNRENKLEFTNFFKSQQFYSIANSIYLNLSKKNKIETINFYKFVTQPKNPKIGEGLNLSKIMYNDLCEQVSIIKSPSDGDCFFAAVSNGINIYNYENQATKIIYKNIYGKTQLFTINLIREIVLRYYDNLSQERKKELFIIGKTNADYLNHKFSESINSNKPVNNEEYIERLNYIYTSDDNFFVYKPTLNKIDIDNNSTPFRVITEGEVQNYIKSKNYWGDEFAIEAICNILGIYIIPINKIRNRLIATVREPDTIYNICSSKVLFLYRKHFHYELIRFRYKQQLLMKEDIIKKFKGIETWYTIFDKNRIPPPFHIFILLYGSSYIYLNQETKDKYIYSSLMDIINNSVSKIITDNNIKFISTFNNIFNIQKSIEFYVKRQIYEEKKEDEGGIKYLTVGGQPPYRYPTYPPYSPYGYSTYPPYSPYGYPPYQNRYITKKPDERDSSKIAYSITIDMEVHPGTSLTPEQINESKCNSKYNAIRKAFSEFTGKPYVIPPVYPQTKKVDKSKLNNTRKIIAPTTAIGGKKNITIRKR